MFNWRPGAFALAIQGCFAIGATTLFALPALATADAQQLNIRALSDKGIYWYERFRFDLAVQSFNKVLLIDPANPSALRWQGLIDLARGDVQAANVWLGKLQITHGNHPFAIELQQAITLAGEKRQQLAELRYLADSEKVPADLPKKLQSLLPQAALGEAAVQIYTLMGRTAEGRAKARPIALELARRFPDDKRYKTLLAGLGAAGRPTESNRLEITRNTTGNNTRRGALSAAKQAEDSTQPPVVLNESAPMPDTVADKAPELSAFEQGQQLADQAQRAIEAGDTTSAAINLQKAVDLNPTYPWFRYDLATLLDDQGDATSKQSARTIMDEGLGQNNGQEMRFASALLAARQDRRADALALMNDVPRPQWTEGMSALEKRVSYGQYLDSLRRLEQQSQFNGLASAVGSTPRWRAEPEVQDIEKSLRRKQQVRVRMSYENALIDGDEGVSKINSEEIPLQIDLPLDFEKTLFVRADTLNANSGRVNLATTTNFAKLGTTVPTDPAIASEPP